MLTQRTHPNEGPPGFLFALSNKKENLSMWLKCLAFSEKQAAHYMSLNSEIQNQDTQPEFMNEHIEDELKHAEMLFQASEQITTDTNEKVFLEMQKHFNNYFRAVYAYIARFISDPLGIYLVSSFALETRVLKHYQILADEAPYPTSETIQEILKDEQKHTHQCSKELKIGKWVGNKKIQEIMAFETRYFERMQSLFLQKMAQEA